MLFQKEWTNLDEDSRSILNRRVFGIAAEEFPLINGITIEENISISGIFGGYDVDIRKVSDIFHIKELLKKYPSDLDYTEKLRCICARAFCNDKKVVVLFDLFKKLNEKQKTNNSLLLYQAAKRMEVAVIYISEDLDATFGAYDLLYKYVPEKREFLIMDFRK